MGQGCVPLGTSDPQARPERQQLSGPCPGVRLHAALIPSSVLPPSGPEQALGWEGLRRRSASSQGPDPGACSSCTKGRSGLRHAGKSRGAGAETVAGHLQARSPQSPGPSRRNPRCGTCRVPWTPALGAREDLGGPPFRPPGVSGRWRCSPSSQHGAWLCCTGDGTTSPASAPARPSPSQPGRGTGRGCSGLRHSAPGPRSAGP